MCEGRCVVQLDLEQHGGPWPSLDYGSHTTVSQELVASALRGAELMGTSNARAEHVQTKFAEGMLIVFGLKSNHWHVLSPLNQGDSTTPDRDDDTTAAPKSGRQASLNILA